MDTEEVARSVRMARLFVDVHFVFGRHGNTHSEISKKKNNTQIKRGDQYTQWKWKASTTNKKKEPQQKSGSADMFHRSPRSDRDPLNNSFLVKKSARFPFFLIMFIIDWSTECRTKKNVTFHNSLRFLFVEKKGTPMIEIRRQEDEGHHFESQMKIIQSLIANRRFESERMEWSKPGNLSNWFWFLKKKRNG